MSWTRDWTHDAACVGHSDLFFPAHKELPASREVREMRARRLCAQCPVVKECEDEVAALRRDGIEAVGIWAFVSYRDDLKPSRRKKVFCADGATPLLEARRHVRAVSALPSHTAGSGDGRRRRAAPARSSGATTEFFSGDA